MELISVAILGVICIYLIVTAHRQHNAIVAMAAHAAMLEVKLTTLGYGLEAIAEALEDDDEDSD